MACNYHNGSIGCHSHTTVGLGCHSHVIDSLCDYHNAQIGCQSNDQTLITEPNVPPCPANITVFTDPIIDTTVKVKADHINELRASIDAERVRRGFPQIWAGSQKTVGDVVDDDELTQLKNAIDEIRAGLEWPVMTGFVEDTGSKIEGQRVEEIRSNLETSKAECVCQCNYACTCNCNYDCTCNCNYECTCNCNYGCTCNCNYACTCNCYYSDKTLKKNIVFI